MVVVQPGEWNMYDQHWLTATLKEKYPFRITDKLETFGVSVNFLVGKYWGWQSRGWLTSQNEFGLKWVA